MNFLTEKSDSETFCLFAFLMDLHFPASHVSGL